MTSEPQTPVARCNAAKREITLFGDRGGKGAADSPAAGRYRDDPRGDLERSVVAQRRPIDQRLPHRLLADRQLRRMYRPVADQIGPGVIGDLLHDCFALRRHPIDRGAGQSGQRHSTPDESRPC